MPAPTYVYIEERSWTDWLLPAAVLLSLLVHVAVFGGLVAVESRKAHKPRPIEVSVMRPPPPPPPPVEKPKPEFLPPKIVKKVTPPPLPASNQSKPIDAPQDPPKPVFGVTKDSVVDDGEGVVVPVGNTLMKEPDKEFTPPEEVQPYYQPEKRPFVPANLVEVTSFPSERDRVMPEYPAELRAQGVEGTVLVEVDIDAEGNVVAARLKRATGLLFDAAAIKAIKASRYNPARRGQDAVPIRVTIPVKFRLR